MKNLNIFIVSLLILCSCTTDFEPDLHSDPVVVINVMASFNEPIKASVTRSIEIGSSSENNIILRDAIVTVALNDGAPQRMLFNEESEKFESDVSPNMGDKVVISAVHSKYGKAEGSTVIPIPVQIDHWEREYRVMHDYNAIMPDQNGNIHYQKIINFEYKLTFTDPGDTENYYLLSSNMNCTDPILEENTSALDEIADNTNWFYLFSDKQISGKTYTLTCSRKFPTNFYQDHYYVNNIKLYSISKEYYLYLFSLFKKYEGFNGMMNEIGLASPFIIYSNINGGTEIVASQSWSEFADDVDSIIREIFNIPKPIYPDN